MPEIVSRKEAIERSLLRYYTGKPCVRHHICERVTKSGRCVECVNGHEKNYHHNLAIEKKKNRKLAFGDAKTFIGKPCSHGHSGERYVKRGNCVECSNERNRTKGAKWKEDNADHLAQYFRAYAQKHAEKIRQYQEQYRDDHKEEIQSYARQSYVDNQDKIKARSKKWRDNYPEEVQRLWNEWHANNIERCLEAKKRWLKNNPEKKRQYRIKWEKKNPEKLLARYHRHRARKRGAEGSYTPDDLKRIYKMQRGFCAYCRDPLDGKFQVDHIIPLCDNGTNYPYNIQLLCFKRKDGCNQSKGGRDPLEFARSRGLLL